MSEPTPVLPEDKRALPESGTDDRERSILRIPLWLALGAMVAALVLAALILSRVASPLYALLFPQEVPVPAGVQVVEHGKPDKGDEYWVYRTSLSGEEVAQFYEKQGGSCRYTPRPMRLDENSELVDAVPSGPYGVAQCAGSKRSGGLGISWQVYIHAGYSEEEGPTIFRLYKIK